MKPLETYYVIICDNTLEMEIYTYPISLLKFDKILLLTNNADIEVVNCVNEMEEMMRENKWSYELISLVSWEYMDGLLELSGHFANYADKAHPFFIINSSSNFLPTTLAFTDLCSLYHYDYELFHVRHDKSGFLMNKQYFIIPRRLKNEKSLKPIHIQLLKMMYQTIKTTPKFESTGFRISNLFVLLQQIEIITEEINEDTENTLRKRLNDFIKPLLHLNLVNRKKIQKYSYYFLNTKYFESQLKDYGVDI